MCSCCSLSGSKMKLIRCCGGSPLNNAFRVGPQLVPALDWVYFINYLMFWGLDGMSLGAGCGPGAITWWSLMWNIMTHIKNKMVSLHSRLLNNSSWSWTCFTSLVVVSSACSLHCFCPPHTHTHTPRSYLQSKHFRLGYLLCISAEWSRLVCLYWKLQTEMLGVMSTHAYTQPVDTADSLTLRKRRGIIGFFFFFLKSAQVLSEWAGRLKYQPAVVMVIQTSEVKMKLLYRLLCYFGL